jgi:hypothetical protein
MVPDIIFPVNLKEREITFAIFHIISRTQTNIEIIISKIFTNNHIG